VTRGAVLVRAELLIGGILALLPALYALAAPSHLAPMFDDLQPIFGVPGGVVAMALGVGAAIIGWIWMLHISRGESEPDRVRWRRSVLTRNRPSASGLASGAVVSTAIGLLAAFVLLNLPLDAHPIRLRTIGAAALSAVVIAGSVTAMAWIVLIAWFDDDH
jgi:tetrahydromethanopterin S-methyltransferase subunit F